MSTITIQPHILEILKRCRCEGTSLFLPEGGLDRNIYEQVNKILTNLGGKWNTKKKAHIFDEDPADAIQDAIMFGLVERAVDEKKLTQFFATPADLAERMVMQAGIMPEHTVLEPSAGEGSIIAAIMEQCPTRLSIGVCELDAKRQQILLKKFGPVINWLGTDFMKLDRNLRFDRIIMNPPFRNGQDIEHVYRAFNLLAPHGRLVAITAPGWTWRTDERHHGFRKLVEQHGHAEEIPAKTFRESGTDIRTMLVELHR
ncbi:MAG TPA: hypothetical protein VGH19_06810 [Verrucomicrobiae bacterium]